MKTALIVGASRGLGRALAQEHLKRGWRVIATVREASALADLASDALQVEILDTTDWAAVDALHVRLAPGSLDLLFVNAGISGPIEATIGTIEPEVFAELMRVNALAPLRLADRYADRVAKGGTVAVMSSGLGSLASNDFGGWEAYRMSKAALNMGLRSLAIRRQAEGKTWLAMTPGWVQTDMGGASAPLTIDQSIPSLTDAMEKRAGQGGFAYVTHENEDMPW
jgi:NAD(P)-dependent dehydrogenase (short-subunit alcohol dehydrogenase family)